MIRSRHLLPLLLAFCGCASGQHLQKGTELFRQERYQEAIVGFEAARRAEPGNAAIENVLGITAGQALALAVALERRSAFSAAQAFELAVLMHGKELYPEAVERFRRIAAAQPGSWVNKYNLGVALVGAKQNEEAAALLEQAASTFPGNANVWSLLGSAREMAGDAAKALEAYERSVRAEPDNPDPTSTTRACSSI